MGAAGVTGAGFYAGSLVMYMYAHTPTPTAARSATNPPIPECPVVAGCWACCTCEGMWPAKRELLLLSLGLCLLLSLLCPIIASSGSSECLFLSLPVCRVALLMISEKINSPVYIESNQIYPIP